jgi:translation machinery-associated protein 16
MWQQFYYKMVKALHKVQKQISKKRGGKPTSLHENSRDSQRLRAAGAREDKLVKLLAAATRANRIYGQSIIHHLLSLR